MNITTTDPRTSVSRELDIAETTPAEVRAMVEAASAASRDLGDRPRSWRAGLLRGIADALEADRARLVETAGLETGLTAARLGGELTRTVYQFQLFADAVDEGSYLEATIDHAAETPMGPGPDLRRMLVPLGPVAVFGASNFPFAFSVPGGDTASALAAGNAVIAKAHPAHPLTSSYSIDAIRSAIAQHEAPRGTFGLVFGQGAGSALVSDPGIRAVAFTGSLRTGRVLMDLIGQRAEPIPFYGELSSINPLIVSPDAAAARAQTIAEGLFASFTGSAGQLCTKPGLAFIPRHDEGIVDALEALVRDAASQTMLSSGIHSSFETRRDQLSSVSGVTVVSSGVEEPGAASAAPPYLLQVDASDFSADVADEAFGPLIVIVRYDDVSDILSAVEHISGALTATLHVQPADTLDLSELLPLLQSRVGRVVFNGYPTGVRVAWAQHHGGPWPATNSIHTSVGMSSMRRFLRPLAWQDAPPEILPVELRDERADVPRRIDGVLTAPARQLG